MYWISTEIENCFWTISYRIQPKNIYLLSTDIVQKFRLSARKDFREFSMYPHRFYSIFKDNTQLTFCTLIYFFPHSTVNIHKNSRFFQLILEIEIHSFKFFFKWYNWNFNPCWLYTIVYLCQILQDINSIITSKMYLLQWAMVFMDHFLEQVGIINQASEKYQLHQTRTKKKKKEWGGERMILD